MRVVYVRVELRDSPLAAGRPFYLEIYYTSVNSSNNNTEYGTKIVRKKLKLIKMQKKKRFFQSFRMTKLLNSIRTNGSKENLKSPKIITINPYPLPNQLALLNSIMPEK